MHTTAPASPARARPLGPLRTRGHVARALSLATVIGLALALLWATPANAHAQLLETDPQDGSEVGAAPEEVVLTFNENIEQIGAEVVITDGDGTEVQDGDPQITGPDLTQPLAADRSAGEYTVQWRVVSADGHPVSGEFTFSATEAAGGEPEDPADGTEDDDGAATQDDIVTEDEGAAAAQDDAAGPGDVDDSMDPAAAEGTFPWGLIFALAAVALVLALVVRARRQLRDREESAPAAGQTTDRAGAQPDEPGSQTDDQAGGSADTQEHGDPNP